MENLEAVTDSLHPDARVEAAARFQHERDCNVLRNGITWDTESDQHREKHRTSVAPLLAAGDAVGDAVDIEANDKVWGVGGWVVHYGCTANKTEQPFVVHALGFHAPHGVGDIRPDARAVEGVVKYRYSTPDTLSEDCICCEGPHVYQRYIEGMTPDRWVYDQLREIPDGARVRLILEVHDA